MNRKALAGERLYQDVCAYAALGEHRTGTEVDRRTSEWLAGELSAAGFDVALEPFPLRQFDLSEATLEAGGGRMPCFPLWWPTPIDIVAPLADLDGGASLSSGSVALTSFPFDPRCAVYPGSGHREKIARAASAGAVAVVAAVESPTGEIVALNCLPGQRRWPVPTVLVRADDLRKLLALAREGATGRLRVKGEHRPRAKASNVIARLGRGRRPVIVSTPQSGWFRCGGERGPGIALFLGLARWVATEAADGSFLLVSTTGHEIGGLGMRRFLKRNAPAPGDVRCWLHLGAGIATWD